MISAATTSTTIATGLTTATTTATNTAMTIAMITINGDSVVAATDTRRDRRDDGQDRDGEERQTKKTEADEQGRRGVEQMQVLTMHVPGSNLPSPERALTSAFITSKSNTMTLPNKIKVQHNNSTGAYSYSNSNISI